MLLKIISTGAISVFGTLCQFIVVVWLGRLLGAGDYGELHFVLASVPVVATLATLGHVSSSARFFSAHPDEGFDWPVYLTRIASAIVPVSVLIAVGMWAASDTGSQPQLLATTMAGVAFAFTQLIAVGMLRAYGHTHGAALLTRTWAILMLAVVALVRPTALAEALWALVGAHIVTALFAFVSARGRLPRGDRPVGREVWSDGVWFLMISSSLVVGRQIDRLVLGTTVASEELAAYGALATLMAGFDVLAFSVGFLLMPQFAQQRRPLLKRRALEVALLTAAAAAVYLVWGDDLLHLLFSGRYDTVAALVPVLTVAGILRAAYSIPSSLLGGRTDSAALRHFAMGNLGLMLVSILGAWALADTWGVVGVAWATVGIWSLRLVFAVVMVATAKPRPELSE